MDRCSDSPESSSKAVLKELITCPVSTGFAIEVWGYILNDAGKFHTMPPTPEEATGVVWFVVAANQERACVAALSSLMHSALFFAVFAFSAAW